MAGLATMPFNPIEEFRGEYRCIFADLRNALASESSGPLEIDRPWDSYADEIRDTNVAFFVEARAVPQCPLC